ncbi:MerR family transcriptional regulator [Kitasatospora phosalacinea]|uniref:MerR family transcriptional regulator n=1 Tax=Kitasatospora phosalacinea TaxID=2065 RepID=UPI0009DFE3F2|nr:MerR family transcriptional regulator [Kitasatospora phosalacinea]
MAEPEQGTAGCVRAFGSPATAPDRTARHSISEVAAASGLSAHTLRWYERIGLLEPVDRSHAGQRRYSDADLARLAFLTKLRLTGMPVADMVRYVELLRAGDGTRAERRELLVAHREEVRQRLADLHATLAVIDLKIEHYGTPALPADGDDTGETREQHSAQDRKSA